MFTWYVVTLKDPIYPVIRVRRPHRPSKRGDATQNVNKDITGAYSVAMLNSTYCLLFCNSNLIKQLIE